MIFVESIEDCEYTTDELNNILGDNHAVARHSGSSDAVRDTMQHLKDGTVPTVVSV